MILEWFMHTLFLWVTFPHVKDKTYAYGSKLPLKNHGFIMDFI